MKRHAPIESFQMESICKVIGGTRDGLTGSEIAQILLDSNIIDTHPGITKWKRLYNAFATWQNNNKCSNNILDFLSRALQPVRYVGKEEVFQQRIFQVNKRLSFIGVEISQSGTLRSVSRAKTISEAEQRASHFKYMLETRSAHSEIFKYCNSELLVENYFHSILKA